MVQELNQINEDVFGLLIAGFAVFAAFVLIMTAIIVDTFRKTAQTRAREQSRREIAAYVAEGSITADDAAKLLASGETLKDLLTRKLG